jgi:hypothetical protein
MILIIQIVLQNCFNCNFIVSGLQVKIGGGGVICLKTGLANLAFLAIFSPLSLSLFLSVIAMVARHKPLTSG